MFNAFLEFLGADAPPNKVQEIKTDDYGSRSVHMRDENMILYGPVPNSGHKKAFYEIVLHRPYTEQANVLAYSLYRSQSNKEVEEKFNLLFQRLPHFIEIAKEVNHMSIVDLYEITLSVISTLQMYNLNGLQKICDALIENPSWSLTHLVVYFNLTQYLMHPKILENVDYPDHITHMTPLQLAIKSNNVEMVQVLLPLCKLDHLDINKNSVYHFAASTTAEMINLLAAQNLSTLNQLNSDGYTPLHLACSKDKPDCVTALLLAGADVNVTAKLHKQNKVNSNLQSSNKPKSFVADLLKSNKNEIFSEDMKFGGTPLHWSSSRKVVTQLIQRNCDVNALNFNQQTALHVMVNRERLECVMCLLSHEALIDLKDNHAKTPLHIAIERENIAIVQALIVFGCDINMPNHDGATPRHMVGKDANGSNADMILFILDSVGASRCPASNVNCPPGCNATGTYNGIPPTEFENMDTREQIQNVLQSTSKNRTESIMSAVYSLKPKEKVHLVDTKDEESGASVMHSMMSLFATNVQSAAKTENTDDQTFKGKGRLLCLDGGGIRGLILVQLLLEIEKLSQTPINHMFDWIAGTSTGGILALGLGCGKTMMECMCLYLRMKEIAFIGSRPYPSEPLEEVLKNCLGEYTVMTDIESPKIMITGVMADRKPVDLHFFRNYTSASEILGIVTPTSNRRDPPPPPDQQLLWRAARASGAAPSYFKSFGHFIDGGLIANNPTLDAITEIHEYNMALTSVGREKEVVPISVVVSLGTGLIPVTEMKEIDIFRPDSIWDTAKLAHSISAIGNLLIDQATASNGRVVDRARAWCSMIGVPFYRLNPQMSVDVVMDETNDEVLVNMLWEAKAYMYANRQTVMDIITILN